MQWPQRQNVTAATCEPKADNLCAAHHRGPLCQVCLEGYYKPTKGSLCVACGSASSIASYSTAGAVALGLLSALLAWLYFRRLRRKQAATEGPKKEATVTTPPLRPRLRIILWRRLCSDSFRNKMKIMVRCQPPVPVPLLCCRSC